MPSMYLGTAKKSSRTRSPPSVTPSRGDPNEEGYRIWGGGDGSKQKERNVVSTSLDLVLNDHGPKSFNTRRNVIKFLVILTMILLSVATALTIYTISVQRRSNHTKYMMINATNGMPRITNVDISIVILASTKYQHLENLLPSLLHQNATNFEIIIVDNGCLLETKKLVKLFKKGARRRSIPNSYLPLCSNDNEHHVVGHKMGANIANKESKWIMFLDDDLTLQGDDFLQQMLNVVDTRPSAGGAVCKLLDKEGERVENVGGIVWSDASTWNYGHRSRHTNSFDLSYPKPVDYGSGACLMILKDTFEHYSEFDLDQKGVHSFFEDVDLQLHIQHNAGKEVWYQPKAVAYHTGAESSQGHSSDIQFQKKWRDVLETKHLLNPEGFKIKRHLRSLQLKRANDLRARDPTKARILWLEEAAPNPDNGSGFGRAFDNLSMAAELGHRITLLLPEKPSDLWCGKECIDRITDLGVELCDESWEDYVSKFIDFYDIVYISRPAIFRRTYQKWQEFYKKHSFALIYDCEALWYSRDKLLLSLLQSEDIYNFPGGMDYLGLMGSNMDVELVKLEIGHIEEVEFNLIQMADAVLAVSDKETNIITDSLPDTKAWTIGHIMNVDESRVASDGFKKRNGILFVASFNDIMYYNGDALWYFITKVYPLVLLESKSRIPLTIAGRKIPAELRGLVRKDKFLSDNVSFQESVADIHELYDSARIVIAPHLYGSGIQYKVSEAFSLGVPTVMSKFTAGEFGIKGSDRIGCVGENVQEMKNCILELNQSEKTWNEIRKRQIEFIQKTHNREDMLKVWSDVIQTNLIKIRDIRKEGDIDKMEHNLLGNTLINQVTEPCPEGERYYTLKYPDVKEALDAGVIDSMFSHYKDFGIKEGRKYLCFFKGPTYKLR